MSTGASKEVKERLEITVKVIKENKEKNINLRGEAENTSIKNYDKNIKFPECIDAYKRVAHLRIRTEELCSKDVLTKLEESNLKLSNGGADILLLKEAPFIEIMNVWADEWFALTRDEATRKIGEYIENNFKIQDFEMSKRFADHERLKNIIAKIFLKKEKHNIFTKAEVLIEKGYKPDRIGLDENGVLTIVEVKTTETDFSQAKETIKKYTTYCNYFYLLTNDKGVESAAQNFFEREKIEHARVLFWDEDNGIHSENKDEPLKRGKIVDDRLIKQAPELLAKQIISKIKTIDWNKKIDENILKDIPKLVTKMKEIINKEIDHLMDEEG